MRGNRWIATMSVAIWLSSCGTYTGSGIYVGATLGSVLGSAIGGIGGGARGSDIGTIVGMAAGAAVGTAIDAQAEAKERQGADERYERRKPEGSRAHEEDDAYYHKKTDREPQTVIDESGFDAQNGGDDRLYDFTGVEYTGDYSAQRPTTAPFSQAETSPVPSIEHPFALEIRNARFVDANQDRAISRGELCKVIFEVWNNGRETIYDVQPLVEEIGRKSHLYISPGIHIEKIEAGKAIRYTALVQAAKRLKAGSVKICVSVLQGNGNVVSKVTEFNIPTHR